MRKRMFWYSLVVLAAGLAVALLLAGMQFENRLTASTEENMRNMVTLMANNIKYDSEGETLQEKVDRLARETGGKRLTLIDESGRVIADSAMPMLSAEDHSTRPEIQEAAVNGVGSDTRPSTTLGKRMTYVAAVTPEGDYLRIAAEDLGLWRGILSLLPVILAAAAVALLVAIPVIGRLSRSICRPIQAFSESIDKVMVEKVRLDVDACPYQELKGMASSINKLSDEVDTGLLHVAREQKKIDAILSNMSEGFVMVGDDDRVLLVNDAACRILDCQQNGDGNFNLLHATRNVPILDAVDEVRREGGSQRLEFDAAGRNYEAAVSSVVTSEGPVGEERVVVMLLSDVSEKHAASQMRQEFFQSASHELKTPITSIRGFAELLCTTPPMDEERQQECAGRILREAKRVDSLVDDILMISRLESGELTFERETVDLYAVVKECCDDAATLASEGGIKVTVEGAPCPLEGSHRELSELVGNLVSNAVKYNHPGGVVEVTLTQTEAGPLLSVFNTGEAIPPTKTDRIFERFYRLDKGRSKAVGGTGLGLAIVKHVVSRYGARVWVTPKRGVGNVFQVQFPPQQVSQAV